MTEALLAFFTSSQFIYCCYKVSYYLYFQTLLPYNLKLNISVHMRFTNPTLSVVVLCLLVSILRKTFPTTFVFIILRYASILEKYLNICYHYYKTFQVFAVDGYFNTNLKGVYSLCKWCSCLIRL